MKARLFLAQLGAAIVLTLTAASVQAVVIAEFDFETADGSTVPNNGIGADGILGPNASVADGVLDLDNMALGDVFDDHGMSIPLGLNNPFGGGTDWSVSFDFSTETELDGNPGALFSSDGGLEVDGEFNNDEQRGSLNVFMNGGGGIVADGWWIGALEGGDALNDGEVHNVQLAYTAESALWELSIDGELVAEEEGGDWEYLRDASMDRVRVGGVSNPDFGFEIDGGQDAFDVSIDNLLIEGTPAPDLNFDGEVNLLDWALFVEGFGSDLSGLSELDAFVKADLNADGAHDSTDFRIFAAAFDASNGAGALAALAEVPEPGACCLLGIGAIALLSLRRKVGRTMGVGVLLCVLGTSLVPTNTARADLLVEYLFDSGKADESFNDTSGNNNDGDGFNFGDDNLTGTLVFDGEQEVVVPLGDANPFDGSKDFSIEFDFSVGFHDEDEAGHLLFSSANFNDPTAGVEHSMSLFVEPEGAIVYDNFFVGEVRINPPESIIDDGQFHNLLVTFQAPEDLGENLDEPNPGSMMMRFDNVWYEGGEIAPNIINIEDHEVLIGASLNEDFPYECEGLECFIRNFRGELDAIRIYDESFAPTQVSATVDRATGNVTLNGGEFGREIRYYELSSEGGSINSVAWSSGNLDSQNLDELGDGSGQSWDVLTGDDNRVVEAFLLGSSSLNDGDSISLPGAWNGSAEDLVLELVTTANESILVDVSYAGEGAGNQGTGVVCDADTGGDLDGNGRVEFADFLILSANFSQQVASHAEGDIDCNGTVEFADFLVLSANFGQTVGSEAASVPEPSSWVMLASVGLLGLGNRRRHW